MVHLEGNETDTVINKALRYYFSKQKEENLVVEIKSTILQTNLWGIKKEPTNGLAISSRPMGLLSYQNYYIKYVEKHQSVVSD